MQTNPTVSVIIMTLNAEREISALLSRLMTQSYPVKEIVVVDSSSEDRTVDICRQYSEVRIIEIRREEFDHAGTRDRALRTCDSDIIVFMTQDAYPVNDDLIAKLIAPLSDAGVAVVTARQIPKEDALPMERLVREYNYPAESVIKEIGDVDRLGIKAFFSSDVCAAYNKEIYEALGGFDSPLKTNEDMFYAAKALKNGYKSAYAADAAVEHSHNLSLKEQYRRNYLQGYEIEKHKTLLENAEQTAEGLGLVKYVSVRLIKKGRILSFLHFGLDCAARYLGNRNGRKAFSRESRGQ